MTNNFSKLSQALKSNIARRKLSKQNNQTSQNDVNKVSENNKQ